MSARPLPFARVVTSGSLFSWSLPPGAGVSEAGREDDTYDGRVLTRAITHITPASLLCLYYRLRHAPYLSRQAGGV